MSRTKSDVRLTFPGCRLQTGWCCLIPWQRAGDTGTHLWQAQAPCRTGTCKETQAAAQSAKSSLAECRAAHLWFLQGFVCCLPPMSPYIHNKCTLQQIPKSSALWVPFFQSAVVRTQALHFARGSVKRFAAALPAFLDQKTASYTPLYSVHSDSVQTE